MSVSLRQANTKLFIKRQEKRRGDWAERLDEMGMKSIRRRREKSEDEGVWEEVCYVMMVWFEAKG